MTQATDTDILQRLDKLTSIVERLDSNVQELRLETKTFQARTEERFNSIDQRFSAQDTQLSDFKKSTDTQLSDLKTQIRAQDTRLWGFIAGLSVAIIGILSKLAFFPTV